MIKEKLQAAVAAALSGDCCADTDLLPPQSCSVTAEDPGNAEAMKHASVMDLQDAISTLKVTCQLLLSWHAHTAGFHCSVVSRLPPLNRAHPQCISPKAAHHLHHPHHNQAEISSAEIPCDVLASLLQERSDSVKSMMALPSPTQSRPPRSPSTSKSTAARDTEPHQYLADQLTVPAQASQQLAVKQVASGVKLSGVKSRSTADMQQPPFGVSSSQDVASNGSSESSELENQEAMKRPLQKKGTSTLRRVQSEFVGTLVCVSVSCMWCYAICTGQCNFVLSPVQIGHFCKLCC